MVGAAEFTATCEGPGATVDARALRRAFGAFATGVTVVTARDAGGEPVGLTVNSFTSVSLDPPMALFCLAESAASRDTVAAAEGFAVSVLAEGQRALARTFATRGVDKFAGVAWRARVTGAPVLDGAAAWFDCRRHALIPAGDHVVLIGRIVAFGARPATPLGYVHGGFFTVEGAPRVTALLTRGPLVLVRQTEEGVALPAAATLGPAEDPESVMGQIAAAGFPGVEPAPFDAFDVGPLHVSAYRAAAPAGTPAPGWAFLPVAEAEAAMLTPGGGVALRRLAAAVAG